MKTKMNRKVEFTLLGIATIALVTSCGPGLKSPSKDDGSDYQQIERLARPAVNEGLVLTNANLNLWNTLPPSADLTSAASGPVGEVATVLGILNSGNNGYTGASTAHVVSGFLPDVMRVDSTQSVAGGNPTGPTDSKTAYNSCLGATQLILCGGRKIADDVMDITLSYLAKGDPTGAAVGDGVTFAGSHTTPLATFPYVAGPH